MSLKDNLVYLAMKEPGHDYPSVCVIDEDNWSITICFANAPLVIPRDQIKSINIIGPCPNPGC